MAYTTSQPEKKDACRLEFGRYVPLVTISHPDGAVRSGQEKATEVSTCIKRVSVYTKSITVIA